MEQLELVREGALAAGMLCMLATMLATMLAMMVATLVAMMVAMMAATMVAVVAMAIEGLAPILAPETQTSGTTPALEMLERSPAPRGTLFYQ